jgi:hypothetical protein
MSISWLFRRCQIKVRIDCGISIRVSTYPIDKNLQLGWPAVDPIMANPYAVASVPNATKMERRRLKVLNRRSGFPNILPSVIKLSSKYPTRKRHRIRRNSESRHHEQFISEIYYAAMTFITPVFHVVSARDVDHFSRPAGHSTVDALPSYAAIMVKVCASGWIGSIVATVIDYWPFSLPFCQKPQDKSEPSNV